MERFWEILDERLELCHRALRCRHERLLGTVSDVAPILWQNGALARLKKGEKIDKLLFNGYSTISLGYAGLYEMCMRMLGKSHTDPEAKPFALAVMQRLNDKCKEWKEAENISYSVYGTPMESTTYKFAKCLQKRFGIIPGVTDKNYITNSYHVHVTEEIDAFSKLKFESEFQKLSPGGAISYIEVPNMQTNIPAVLSVLQYIYENIMYAELNTKSDFCEESTDLFSAPSAYPKRICERDFLSRASWQVWLSGKNNTGKWRMHQYWRIPDLEKAKQAFH